MPVERRDDLAALRRWEDAGGTWVVMRRHAGSVTVSLCRCDGGEEAERLVSEDPALVDYLGGRDRSEDPAT